MKNLVFPPLVELLVSERVSIDIAYSQANHPDNAFGALYTNKAKMLLHPTLASIVHTAADCIPAGEKLCVKDGLRTVEAQKGMVEVKIKNQWPDSLVSPPGFGGHPRGCAVDIMRVEGETETEIDVGTRFDDFEQIDSNGKPMLNHQVGLPKASRSNPFLTTAQRHNQWLLERAMIQAGLEHDTLVMALPQEHWDFRFPETYADLSHVLDSISRLLQLKKPQDTADAISNYDDFLKAWNERFSSHRPELVSLLGRFDPPSEHSLIFSSMYSPVTDLQLVEMAFPAMTNSL